MSLWGILEPSGSLLRVSYTVIPIYQVKLITNTNAKPQALCLILQVREAKRTKSIYGLSFDYVTLTFVELLTSMLFLLSYTLSSAVHQQYARRFPLSPKYTLDFVQSFSDALSLIFIVTLVAQCFKYRSTRHQFQSVSKGSLTLLSVSLLAVLFVLNCVNFKDTSQIGRHGLFLIDLIDFLWVIENLSSMVKWAPQLTTNLIGMNACQITRQSSLIELGSTSLIIMGRLARDQSMFHEFPVNEQGFLTMLGRLILVSLNVYQVKLYQGSSKRLSPKTSPRHDQYSA